jgi:hypothetical protein
LPLDSATRQGSSVTPVGATNSQADSSIHAGGNGSASSGARPGAAAGSTSALPGASHAERSQADVDVAMRKRGYKPASFRGGRVYCREENLTGSNLASKVCLTARQIEDQEQAGKDILTRNRPAGCAPSKMTGCN